MKILIFFCANDCSERGVNLSFAAANPSSALLELLESIERWLSTTNLTHISRFESFGVQLAA